MTLALPQDDKFPEGNPAHPARPQMGTERLRENGGALDGVPGVAGKGKGKEI